MSASGRNQEATDSGSKSAGIRRLLASHHYSLLVPVAAWLVLNEALQPIDDVDSFWHVRVGDEIVRSGQVTGLGNAWSAYEPPEPWTTSQWLSEVTMSWAVEVSGWSGLVVWTFVLTMTLVVTVLWITSKHGRGRVTILFASFFLASLVIFVQTRPLLISAIGTAAIGHAAARILMEGKAPPLWSLPIVALWANFHGQWVLAPVAIGWAALLYWLGDPRGRARTLPRTGGMAVAMLAAGLLNPLGLNAITLPFTLRSASDHLNEWQLTTPWSLVYLPFAVILATILASWLTSRAGVSWVEVVYVLSWTTFSLLAFRNILPAMLILLPLTVRAVERLAPAPSEERRPRALPLALVWLASAALTAVSVARIDPLANSEPLQIARHLSSTYDSVTVLNDYDAAGVLVAFGPPGIRVGIDGRVERYGDEFITSYIELLDLKGEDWQASLEKLGPDVAVVRRDRAVRHLLEEDWGWRRTLTDGTYLLLERPGR